MSISLEELRRFEPPRAYSGLATHGGAVYRLRNADGALLYVGVGDNPAQRIRLHAKRASWWPDVDLGRSDVGWFRRYTDAQLAERIAIRLERPRHNMIHSETRPHWSHDRGRKRKPPTFDEGTGLTHTVVRSDLEQLVYTVGMHRRTVFIEHKGNSPGAAVVPMELGTLAIRLGGADRAAAILLDHIRAQERDGTR